MNHQSQHGKNDCTDNKFGRNNTYFFLFLLDAMVTHEKGRPFFILDTVTGGEIAGGLHDIRSGCGSYKRARSPRRRMGARTWTWPGHPASSSGSFSHHDGQSLEVLEGCDNNHDMRGNDSQKRPCIDVTRATRNTRSVSML